MVKPENPIIARIKQRLHDRNQNFIAVCVGQTGSGKSWAMMRLAEKCDPTFGVSRVVFDLTELASKVNKGLPPGTFFVLDEAGIAAGAREWQSKVNRLINYMLQTFRSKNYGLLLTVPDIEFIDKQTRKLVHAIFEMKSIDYDKKRSKIKPLLMQNNPRSGKTYQKYLKYKLPDGRQVKVRNLLLRKPTKELVTNYERKKDKFLSNLLSRIELESRQTTGNGKGIERQQLHCNQCDYEWRKHTNLLNKLPDACPKCYSKRWNEQKIKKIEGILLENQN